jgi:hypothetical protein
MKTRLVIVASVLASSLWLSLATSVAGVIYEFHEQESTRGIGTWEVAAPPASASSGWSTRDPSDLMALFLDNATFGLGSGNLLTAGGTLSFSDLQSLAGPTLDAGFLGIMFPTATGPGNTAIAKNLVIDVGVRGFGAFAATDFIAVATYFTFPDGTVAIGDLFIFGDWVARGPKSPNPVRSDCWLSVSSRSD